MNGRTPSSNISNFFPCNRTSTSPTLDPSPITPVEIPSILSLGLFNSQSISRHILRDRRPAHRVSGSTVCSFASVLTADRKRRLRCVGWRCKADHKCLSTEHQPRYPRISICAFHLDGEHLEPPEHSVLFPVQSFIVACSLLLLLSESSFLRPYIFVSTT